MPRIKLDWKGDAVLRKVQKAAMEGINEVMGECVITAKNLVRTKTFTLQGSIRLTPAVPTGRGARGTWGSFDVNYALWQEVLPSPRGRAYLRPASDMHYPSLAGRIKAKLK